MPCQHGTGEPMLLVLIGHQWRPGNAELFGGRASEGAHGHELKPPGGHRIGNMRGPLRVRIVLEMVPRFDPPHIRRQEAMIRSGS